LPALAATTELVISDRHTGVALYGYDPVFRARIDVLRGRTGRLKLVRIAPTSGVATRKDMDSDVNALVCK